MKAAKMQIIQNPKKPVPAEIIADALIKLSRGIKELNETKLNKNALIILLSHTSGVGVRNVESVIDSLATMETDWIKK